ncbi:type III-B CRISPR module RAMP protein Cmr6 [Vibrio sp. WXL210]|uniref:type III-B CRISPR module RAMP protein Cmr6 n=1 Tax=Vibrio sp. WXL210 TaxID=3450709 RepID=UPI003EC73606
MANQLPHYFGCQDVLNDLDLTHANTGLLFNRFFNRYDSQWQIDQEGEGKEKTSSKVKFLQSILSAGAPRSGQNAVGDREKLSRFYQRQTQLSQQLGGISLKYKSEWNWVSGLGYAHPVENGLKWHPTLAVPFFSGSSIKGLLRAWMETQQQPDLKAIQLWFGSEDKRADKCKNEPSQGGLIFFDALPVEPVSLVLDVMTPHCGNWLSEGGQKNAPADWINPVPVPFLSCAPAVLHFSIAPVPGQEAAIDMSKVAKALSDALDFLGLGAKTSNGYGLFTIAE